MAAPNQKTVDKIHGVYVMDALHSFRKPATFTQILNFIAKNHDADINTIQDDITSTIQNGLNHGFIFKDEADKLFMFRKRIKNELLAMDELRIGENSDEQPMESDAVGAEENPPPPPPTGNVEEEHDQGNRTVSARSIALDPDEIEYLEQLSDDENWSNQKSTRRGRSASRQKQPARDRSRSRLSRPQQKE